MKIFAEFITGEQITVEVDPSTTIGAFKDKVLESAEMTKMRVALIYGGKSLETSKTVSDYDLKDSQTIIFVVPLLN